MGFCKVLSKFMRALLPLITSLKYLVHDFESPLATKGEKFHLFFHTLKIIFKALLSHAFGHLLNTTDESYKHGSCPYRFHSLVGER